MEYNKEYNLLNSTLKIDFHFDDESLFNRWITQTQVRYIRILGEYGQLYKQFGILIDLELIIDVQEYEKITKNKIDISNIKGGLYDSKKN